MNVGELFNPDRLIGVVREEFEKVLDGRLGKVKISLADALMSGYAMFALKDPSLLAFDARRQEPENLQRIYQLTDIPSDSQMRTILDEVSLEEIRPGYRALWEEVKESGVLSEGYLVSLDGSQYFASHKVHCPMCLEKRLRNGEVLYHHQMLAGVLVSPDRKEVLPLFPEPIVKQDGATKNDCERNAAKRFITKLRQDHPELPLVIVEDGLSSNGPHIQHLQAHQMHFILGAKESDHAHLFAQIGQAVTNTQAHTLQHSGAKGSQACYRWVCDLALNASYPELLVNVVQYWETTPEGKTTHWTWVTDLSLTTLTVPAIMHAGRARWKVENETFNSLKNQGYHFEHNFGHGDQFLSALFATLMILVFLVDQLLQLASPLFQDLWHKLGSKHMLWQRIRALFFDLPLLSMTQLYQALLYGYRVQSFVVFDDTG